MAPLRILLLQHAAESPPGTLADALERRNANVHHVKVWKGVRVPQSVAPFDGVVVLGGPWSAWEDDIHPALPQEVSLLKEAVRDDVPTLGICLGSQLLARAAGAHNFSVDRPEIGWYPIDVGTEGRSDRLLEGMPPRFPAFLWHFDGYDMPPGATGLARSERFPLQAFRVGARQWGVLFHPEKTAPMIRGQLERNRATLSKMGPEFDPDAIGAQTRALEADHTRRALRMFDNFLTVCRS